MQNIKKLEKINILRDFYKKIIKIFFEEICLECEKSGEILCYECREKIKLEKNINNNLENINWIKSSLSYKNEILKKALFALKYNHTKNVAKYLAEMTYLDFLNFLKEISKNKNIDFYADFILNKLIIIPIPISKKRLIERDYNQTELIIKEIIKILKEKENINLENNLYLNLLLKNKNTIKFSHTHSHTDREKLIKDVFEIQKLTSNSTIKFPENDQNENKIIILIDDITTTGATFYEARKTLIDFGFQKENIFAFAVAH